MRKACVGFLVIVAALGVTAVQAADFSAWSKTASIQFAGYSQAGTLTNFPALVVLGTNTISGFNYGDFRSGLHDDLRFTASDGTQELYYEVDSWNTNGLSYVWVQVPFLVDSNTSIRIYWGNSSQTSPAYTTNGSTWSEGYVGVWHLGDSATNSGSTRTDSSQKGHHGTTSNNVAKAVSGVVNGADEFHGGTTTGDSVVVPNHTDFYLSSNYAMSGWFRLAAADKTPYRSITARETSSNDRNWWLSLTNGAVWWKSTGNALDLMTPQDWADDRWHHFAAVLDGSTARLYCDGTSRVTQSGVTGVASNANSMVWIGSERTVANRFFKGGLDDMRIATVPRAANWVWAEYVTAASNAMFTSYSGVMSQGLPIIQNVGVSNITAAAADAYGYLTSTGSAPTTVLLYSGPVNGGTNAGSWAATNVFAGAQSIGPLSNSIPLLQTNTTYYFRYCATNASGAVWAPSTFSFAAYALTVTATDPLAAEEGVDPGAFTISRPPGVTNDDVTVLYTVGGTATPGSDYTALNGTTLIPAGATSVTVAVTALRDMVVEPAETVTLTLQPGTYIIGSPASASVTITNDVELSQWSHKALITFGGYTRSEPLTNFPALVTLGSDTPGFSYADMLSAPYADLRFSDASGTNELAYEVERWDTNGTSSVWVRVPVLADSNTCMWVYWGRSGLGVPAYTTNGATWTEGYAGVWHLGETVGPCRDSTVNGNNGSVSNATLGVSGRIGGGASFDGSNDWIQVEDNASLRGMTNLTIETWVNDQHNDFNPRGLVSKRVGANTEVCYFLYSQTNNLLFYVNRTNGGEIANTVLGSNVWRHLVATFDPALATDEEKIYLDGSLAGARPNIQLAVSNAVSPLCIGILHPNFGYGWLGQLDEVRISRVTRSTNWIWASWMNQASNTLFATVLAAAPGVTNLAATGVTAGSATLNGSLLTTGQAPTTVSVYWGPVDGGTTSVSWATNVTFAGSRDPGPLSSNVGLSPDTVYYYRYQATNVFGPSWSSPAAALMTGEVGIEAADPGASEVATNTGAFSIFRPIWATGIVSRVAYSITGTASNGVDYVTLTNSVDIPVGATNVVVTVTPIVDTDYTESDETVTLTLEPGAYVVGASNTATVMITNLQASTVAMVSGTGDDATGDGSVAHPFRSITRALTNTPAYTLIYVDAGSYTTNNGEVFPLVVPGGTSLIGLGGAADAVIDAGNSYRGLTLSATSSSVTNLIGNLSLLHTKGTAIAAYRWQGTLTNLVISGVANGGAVETCSVISYTNNASRSVTLSGVVVSNVSCNVQKFMWFRGLGTVSFVNCVFRNLETSVAPVSEVGTFFFTGVDGYAAGNTGFSCTLTDCVMDGITVPGVASTRAGLFVTGNGASFTLDRCVVRNVTLSGVGTTVFVPELGNGYAKNCLFNNIECGSYSLFGGYLAAARLRNCTIQNVTSVFRPQALIEADNCVMSDCGTLNLVTADSLYLKNVNYYNTAIGVGYNEANSTNVTTVDPWFVNAAGGDFHLRTLSPLVDAGNNGYMADARDLDKATRTLDGNADGTATVDLGAYEVNFMAPVTARFMTAFPAYNANEGQVLHVPVWIQPPVAGSVTAAVTYGTNVGGVATLNFPTGSETNTLSITVQSPLSVSNGTRVAVSLAESITSQGVAAGDIGLNLFTSIVTVPGYQARTFVRAGVTNQYHVQMPNAALMAASDLTVTVGSAGGTGSNSITWVGGNVITAGTWRTDGYLQVVGRGGENTIGISIDGGMNFSESGNSNLAFAFVGYDSPVFIAPSGDDAAGLGTAAAPFKSLTFALSFLQSGEEARMSTGLYSTNSGEVFPVTVPEGITVRGTLGPNADAADSSVIDANGSGFNFILGTLGPDNGVQGAGGLFNLVMTDAKGTAIRARYWGGSVSNCVIRNVINGGAQDSTAGLRVENSGRSVTLADLTITNINSDASRILLMEGGSTATLSRCQFQNLALSATSADGVFAFTDHLVSVTDCVFGNIAWPQTAGGGVDGGFLRVYNNVRGSLTIDRCIFHHLTVTSGDNMIVCPNRTVPTNIRNSLFYNIAGGSVRPVIGQLLSNPQVRNCTIDGAVTAFRGGSDTNYSIYVYNSSVSYCSNLCSSFGSQLRLNSVNVYATPSGLSYDTTNSASVTAYDPIYRDRSSADYRLHPRSRLVEAGLTNYVLSTLDLALTNRIMGSSVDLGAYETVPTPRGGVYIVR